MNILHIIGSMDPASGGPCQGIRYINSESVLLGVTREVVCLDSPDAKFLGQDSFPVHAVGPARTKWQYSAKLKPWLIENIDRFDVVIVNGIWIYSSFSGYRIIRYLKKIKKKHPEKSIKVPKFFIMPHGMLDPYFQQAKSRKLKAVRNFFYWIFIEHKVINSADAILFTCKTELLLARKTFFFYNPRKEVNVGYGIYPPPAFSEKFQQAFLEYCPEAKSKPFILFLSRIHEKKGVDILIKSYAALVNHALNESKSVPLLVVAGPGLNTNYGKKIVALALSYPEIQNLVFFTGMVSGDAKWGALHNCEAFVLPSHQENFGIAVVEAMACKKPVLISNQINIWMEIIEDGGGMVVPDTLETTKNMLCKWLDLPLQEREKMGLNSWEVFNKKFHIGLTSLNLLKAISE